MFKRFIAAFLGSMTAIWLSIALIFIGGLILLVALLGKSIDGNSYIDDPSILYIDLSGSYSDRESNPSVSDFMMGNVEVASSYEVLSDAIRYAAKDDQIQGIYLDCGGSSMGFGLREELVETLKEFKDSGKWIYAYGDSYTQGDYYVASVADFLCVNPVGQVTVSGLASQTPFFKNALDKLGIEVQIVKVGTFKSAVEPFILTEPSEASKLQTGVFLNAIWDNISSTIAENRGVTATEVNAWADSIITCMPAESLKAKGVVMDLAYRHTFEDRLREITDTDLEAPLPVITPEEYVTQLPGYNSNSIPDAPHIAIYYATGDISDSGTTGIVGSVVVEDILELARNENVLGLVLRVNSGGGSAFASEQIWEALETFKNSGVPLKPFYVSMADYAASGGYYISCGADRIYADANTLTGSIGIFGMIPNVNGLLSDHLGVNVATVQTNDNASMMSIFQNLTPAQHQAMQSMVEDGYRLFTGRVAEGRGIPVDSILSIAEGRVWDGQTALRIGLVDQIGTLTTAVRDMAEQLGMDQPVYASYPVIEKSPLQLLINQSANLSTEASDQLGALTGRAGFETLTPAEARQCIRLFRTITTCSPIQARMESMTLK